MLDFFDFFLIAFVMSAIGLEWHLTYGQGALILCTARSGARRDCRLADLGLDGRCVRAPDADQQSAGTIICSLCAGLIGLPAAGRWVLLAVLRFLVGLGLAAGVTPALTIIVQTAPCAGAPASPASLSCSPALAGRCVASFTSAILLHASARRGVAMTGFVAIIVGLLVWMFVPDRRVGSPPRAASSRRGTRSLGPRFAS